MTSSMHVNQDKRICYKMLFYSLGIFMWTFAAPDDRSHLNKLDLNNKLQVVTSASGSIKFNNIDRRINCST